MARRCFQVKESAADTRPDVRRAPGMENGMITSLSNSRVKNVTALNRKAKERKSQEKYVVEGVRMFLEAPEGESEEI